jgi:hypothetical protein
VNADARLCAMLEELQGAPDGGWAEVLTEYSKNSARKLRQAHFDPAALAARHLKYEQIDQRLTEILLGLQ